VIYYHSLTQELDRKYKSAEAKLELSFMEEPYNFSAVRASKEVKSSDIKEFKDYLKAYSVYRSVVSSVDSLKRIDDILKQKISVERSNKEREIITSRQ
jgi:hypothetical protein